MRAIDVVLELAWQNALDPDDPEVQADADLSDEAVRQERILNMVQETVEELEDSLPADTEDSSERVFQLLQRLFLEDVEQLV